MNEAIRMQLSAFADGELPDNEKELLLRRLSQDAEMRRQVAEYLSIGRAIRGEAPVAGIDSLRDRIADAIGAIDSDVANQYPETTAGAEPRERKMIRPLLGFAVAASVALIAIVGLRQLTEVEDLAPAPIPVAETDAGFPTTQPLNNVLEQYRMLHDAEAAVSSMRTRVTSAEIRQGIVVDSAEENVPAIEQNVELTDPESEPDLQQNNSEPAAE